MAKKTKLKLKGALQVLHSKKVQAAKVTKPGVSKPQLGPNFSKPNAPSNTTTNSEATNTKKHPPKRNIPFTAEDYILLIGEGNFSFANSLANLLQTGENIVATCFDSEETVHEKYPDAADEIQSFMEMDGQVLFGVDGTKLGKNKALKNRKFTRVVFNFPHVGAGIKDQDRNILENTRMLKAFFESAMNRLTVKQNEKTYTKEYYQNNVIPNVDGEILVTLKTGEPYSQWDIKGIAKVVGLKTKTSFEFLPEWYEGYSHRRTIGFEEGLSKTDNEELRKQGCRTYVFTKASASTSTATTKKPKKSGSDSDDD